MGGSRLIGVLKKGSPQEPWITEEVLQLSEERSKLKQEKIKDPSLRPRYNFLNREIHRKTKDRKDKWLQELCSKVENAHQAAKSKEVYSTIKKITKTTSTRMQSVKNKVGKILTEQEEVKTRWKENYQELYNEQNSVNEEAARSLPIIVTNETEPSLLKEEVESAIKKLSDGKAPRFDTVSAEEIKAAGEEGTEIFYKICKQIWETELFPEDWGRAIITPIYKKKDKLDCGNYRGISLLSHAGKIMSIILQRRILQKTEQILSEAQAGFRPGRATVDQIFSLRQLAEKYLEKDKHLYCCYIDFQKAFDSVWQNGLWRAMAFFGYPTKIIRLLQALYKQSQSAVRVNGELTDWFTTAVGVRQGCVISPQLFNILLELVMLIALEDTEIGATIQGCHINNLRFADDIVLIAENPEDLQTLVDKVFTASSDYGLKINIQKTEVQVISKRKQIINININNNKLNQVENFVYLGGTIAEDGTCGEDIKTRVCKAGAAFQRLNDIWTSKNISKQTKMQLYQSLILSILLYGAETWTTKKDDENRLNVFEMSCLRRILGVSRLDKIRNSHIKQSLNLKTSVTDRVSTKRLKYFGHVARLPPHRNPKIALEGQVQGIRPRGRPLKKWLDCLAKDCEERSIQSLYQARRLALDRKTWQHLLMQKPSQGDSPVWTA